MAARKSPPVPDLPPKFKCKVCGQMTRSTCAYCELSVCNLKCLKIHAESCTDQPEGTKKFLCFIPD